MAWPTAWGGAVGTGRLAAEPQDFQVDEILGFEPSGSGEHALLWVAKERANSAEVAAALARYAGVARSAVGFAGRKDRNALTRQWFSVQLPGRASPDWAGFDSERWRVEQATRHRRRLRVGSHAGNRFRLRIRDFAGASDRLAERIAALRQDGFPNYFGPQRFGAQGENLRRARAMLVGGERVSRGRRGLYLSAARSWLFNQVLAQRVVAGNWLTPLRDDAIMLAGTHSQFRCTGEEEDLGARVASGDVHVTGPLWGRGVSVAGTAAETRERAWLASEVDLCRGLEGSDVAAARRALRALPTELDWSLSGCDLEIQFCLPPGTFATALLFELATMTEG